MASYEQQPDGQERIDVEEFLVLGVHSVIKAGRMLTGPGSGGVTSVTEYPEWVEIHFIASSWKDTSLATRLSMAVLNHALVAFEGVPPGHVAQWGAIPRQSKGMSKNFT